MIESVVIAVSLDFYNIKLVGIEELISKAKLSDEPSRIWLITKICNLISHYFGKTIIEKGDEANVLLFILKRDDNGTRTLKVLGETGQMITLPCSNDNDNFDCNRWSSTKIKFIFNSPYS